MFKKYLLFAGPECYPGGGLIDYVDSFDTISEAVNAGCDEYQWWHVLDTESMNVLFQYRQSLISCPADVFAATSMAAFDSAQSIAFEVAGTPLTMPHEVVGDLEAIRSGKA